jgi:hypothetical protein
MIKIIKILTISLFYTSSFIAQAGLITIGGGSITGPDRFEDFTYGTSIAGVSNEFSNNGLSFVTLSGAGISLIENSTCGNSGVSGEYLYMGVIPLCNGNSTQDSVSIQFDTDVTDLSWTGFSRANGAGFNIEALMDGVVVSSLVFDGSNTFENSTVLLSGSTFDEIRFSENSTSGVFFALDNMSWNTTQVPEPVTLVLFGFGLAGIGLLRKRKHHRLVV